MNADHPTDPTKIGPVTTRQLARLGAVARALPGATREEITVVQEALQAAPPDAVVFPLDPIRAREPVTGLGFVATLERAKAAVPVPEPPPALLGDQAVTDPRRAQATRELEARLQTWSNYTLAVVATLLAEYEPWWQRQPEHAVYRPRPGEQDGDAAA